MIVLRGAGDRGHANYGWLDTHHSFSFGSYYDVRFMGFRVLRVINEDRVAPGHGFGRHPHRDMEIVTYVMSVALEHKDSMGNGEVLRAGELQRMSAGTGIEHSESNPSSSEPVHLYQIWLMPLSEGIAPSYEQKSFPEADRKDRLRLVVSPDGEDGSLRIHQNARIYLATLDSGKTVDHPFQLGRHGWLQVLRGSVRLNDNTLHVGDGAAISDEQFVTVQSVQPAEVMLFDLP
ncbi:MAG: pirin family protein [Aureliella sp.]